jgi:rubrerythrin
MDPKSLATLSDALRCEYRARAIYRAALDRFGAVEPFVHLAESGKQDIDALHQLHQRNRSEPPLDDWMGRLELPQTLEQARHEAIEAETETADTCERLLDEVDDPIVRMILSRLEEASRYQRLPLLRQSLERQKA